MSSLRRVEGRIASRAGIEAAMITVVPSNGPLKSSMRGLQA
jgi:hypothetical protein